MAVIKPRTAGPGPAVHIPDGGEWTLKTQSPRNFTVLVFYREHHRPICKRYPRTWKEGSATSKTAAYNVIAINGDTREHAEKSKQSWVFKN